MTQLITNGLKDPQGLFTLEKTYDVLAVDIEPESVEVSGRVSALAEASGKAAGAAQVSSAQLFGELSLAKTQIVENVRAAMTYQSALLSPALMSQLVSHFSTSASTVAATPSAQV